MFLYKNRIVFTGGSGRFGKVFKNKEKKTKFKFYFPEKSELDILNIKSIKKYLKNKKPKYLMHLAGLSRPMKIHAKDIIQSIDKNIIGTANITKVCSEFNIKLIYMSTCYVYPGTKGNYSEESSLKPINKYAWSKLGGESSVMLYKNSLILRASITEKPFVHKVAFYDFKTNFIFHEDLISNILKLINHKGIVNIGGKSQSVYNFVKKHNPRIKKISAKKILGRNAPLNIAMNINKFRKLIND
jgi:dTDP-4-dehydrorhamnose reductase|tara:strand:+ start:152 stop:880 length:729 start_codon:yes stop_codon:yes gene_type:complete